MANVEDLEATMYFLVEDDLYLKVKPYYLQQPSSVLPRHNLIFKDVNGIPVQDLRGREHEYSFEENGFAVLQMDTSLTLEDFTDPVKIAKIYCREVAASILGYLKGSFVQVIDWEIRRRHPQFPFSKEFVNTMDKPIMGQPAMQAHVDSSPESVRTLIKVLNGEDEGERLMRKPYVYVNIWKPLKGPVRDWPLALCNASTCDLKDLVWSDVVWSSSQTENAPMRYSPKQEWHYLSNQMPNELLLFRQIDREYDTKRPVGHNSFQNPLATDQKVSYRESIELRALVYFD